MEEEYLELSGTFILKNKILFNKILKNGNIIINNEDYKLQYDSLNNSFIFLNSKINSFISNTQICKNWKLLK